MSSTSLYDVLGVKKTDSCLDIKKAYLKLARIHHPDKGGDPERFKEIQHASEILTDEDRRRLYDQHGVTDPNAVGGAGMGGAGFPFPFEVNLNDLFGNMFGGIGGVGPRGGPIRKQKKPAPSVQTIPIRLEQFYVGHQVDIQINRQTFCSTCDHTGAKTKEVCRTCGGHGSITQAVQMGPMTMHTTGPCVGCQAKGEKILEPCGVCGGSGFLADSRSLKVKIVPGTPAGEVIVFQEVCSDHPGFERPGDVHIHLQDFPSDPSLAVFRRTGDRQQHLETTVTLTLSEAVTGCVVRLDHHPGYDDGLFIRLPAGCFHGDTCRVESLGMPLVGQMGKYGDLWVKIVVQMGPAERTLYATKGRDALMEVVRDHVRTVDAGEETVFSATM